MDRIIKTLTTPTAKSSAIYYFGSFALGIGRYFFHLVLLRLLLPSEYGEFLAYLSLLYLLGIPNSTINNIVVKFVAEFRGKKDNVSTNRLFYYLIKKLSPLTLVLACILIIFNEQLAQVFKAHPTAFIILGISVMLGLFSSVVRSYLSALHRFTAQTMLGAADVTLTIILAVIFIKLRLSATGAVLAQLLAGTFSLLIMFFLIKDLIYPPAKKKVQFKLRGFAGFSLVYAIGSLSLISTDILLVRYFFNEHLSGIYSSLSVIGRSIYFALGPLISLVLPIAAHRHAATNSAKSVFMKLGAVMVIFGSGAVAIFTFFPKLIIKFVSGVSYLEAANYLPLFGLTMLLFSLNIFIVTYFMAIGKPKPNYYLLAAALFQPVFIFIFHRSLNQVVYLNLILETALFLILLWQVKSKKI